jgi:hypothetical protein
MAMACFFFYHQSFSFFASRIQNAQPVSVYGQHFIAITRKKFFLFILAGGY